MVPSASPALMVSIFCATSAAYFGGIVVGGQEISPLLQSVDPSIMLGCHRRVYSYKVSKTDSQGRVCWDTISMMSCWGRCDSNEISDYRFPYKRSFHPVCLYDSRELATVVLSNCEEGVEPGTEVYQFLQAVSCKCHVCKSSEASCEGLRYRRPPDTDLVQLIRK